MKIEELLKNYENLDLKKLPEVIKKNGFDYKLIKRENEKCIYSQQINEKIIGYEVFKTKIVKHREAMIRFNEIKKSKSYQEFINEYREVFPGDEEFGKRAWSYKNFQDALHRYDKLTFHVEHEES